jgi:hypothetical protein
MVAAVTAFDDRLGRAVSVITSVVASLAGWRAFGSHGKRRALLWATVGLAVVVWIITAIAILPGDAASGNVDTAGASPSQATAAQAASSNPSLTPSPMPSSTISLPPPLLGAKAPTKRLTTGQSGEFFGSEVRVGMGSIYSDFVGLSMESQYENCDVAAFHVGKSLSLEGSQRPDGGELGPRIWYRVTVLEVVEDRAATVRVERLQADTRPNQSESCF